MNLDITRYAIQDITTQLETDVSIWKNIRHEDIRRHIQNFLYRAMTGSLRIGDFWSNIPNYEIRAMCQNCQDTTETLEHILTECATAERSQIWNLTREIWPSNPENWVQPSIGILLGCGSISATNNGPTTTEQRGTARLKRILLSESTHLIWTLRCERVIGGQTHTENSVRTKWRNKINARIDIDRRMAKSSRKQNQINKVRNTWKSITKNQTDLPQDWVTNLEVLVGIKLPRPPD